MIGRFLILLVLSSTVLAGNVLMFSVLDSGIYNEDKESPKLLESTAEVPAVVGTVFGVRVRNDAESAATLSYRWSFPEMQNPADGRIWTEMSGQRELVGGESFLFSVRVNQDWEAVTRLEEERDDKPDDVPVT